MVVESLIEHPDYVMSSREEQSPHSSYRLIFIKCFKMMSHVHGSPLRAFNLDCYNSLGMKNIKRLRFNHFQNMNCRPIRVHELLRVSKNRGLRLNHFLLHQSNAYEHATSPA